MAEHFDDPPRWSEAGSGAPAELRTLLRDAERDLPTARELASLAARLELSPAPSPTPGPAPVLAPRAARLLAPIGVLVLAGAGVLVARGLSPSDEPVTSPSATNVVSVPAPSSAPSPEPRAVTPQPAAEPSSPAAPAVTSNAPPRAPAAGSAARLGEAELLELARRALATDPARALRLTERHKQNFPKGVLRQEREVIAIEALRRLGRAKAANQRAGEFEEQFPDSAHRRGVEAGHGKP